MATSRLEQISGLVDDKIRQSFYKLGHKVAWNPFTTIVLCFVCTMVCSLGYLNFDVLTDNLQLYTPSDSPGWKDKDYVEDVWGYGYLTDSLYVTGDGDTTNALSKLPMLSMMDAYDVINSHTAVYEGETISFASLCRRINGYCWTESVLDAFSHNRTLIESLTDSEILARINSWDGSTISGLTVSTSEVIGGATTDSSGNILSAKAQRLRFVLENEVTWRNGDDRAWKAQKWEHSLKEPLLDDGEADRDGTKVYLFTRGGRRVVETAALTADVGLLPLGYTFLVIYAAVIMSRRNGVHSQSMLALSAVFSVLLSTLAAFGLVSAFLKFSLVVQGSLLLLLGLGIDDSFVIVNAFRLTDASLERHERIALAVSDAGAAILVTSITDFAAFLAGSISNIPAIHVFCVYSGVGVLFDFLFQITFFVACFTLDTARQEAKRADCCPCLHPSPDNDCISSTRDNPVPFDHTDRGRITTFFIQNLSRAILSTAGKIIVGMMAVGMLVGGAIFASRLEAEFDERWFVPDGSYIDKSQSIDSKYFESSSFVHTIYTKEGNYFDGESDLNRIDAGIPNLPHVRPSTIFSWHTAFSTWHNDTITDSNYVSKVLEFLDSDAGNLYRANIKFSNDNSTILGSRIQYLAKIGGSDILVDVMDEARDLSEASTNIEATAFHFFYIFLDGLKVMKSELFRNLFISGSAVFVVIGLLLAHVPLSALVLAMVVLIDVELLGFAHLVGYSYNAVTVINCLVTVGIAVDYNVHIAHSFYSATGSRQERAQKALHHIGGAVLCGGLTTFLAILPLSMARTYIFRVFFTMMSFMIAVALFHGLCVLPVILSLVGPQGGGGADRMTRKTSSASPADAEMHAITAAP